MTPSTSWTRPVAHHPVNPEKERQRRKLYPCTAALHPLLTALSGPEQIFNFIKCHGYGCRRFSLEKELGNPPQRFCLSLHEPRTSLGETSTKPRMLAIAETWPVFDVKFWRTVCCGINHATLSWHPLPLEQGERVPFVTLCAIACGSGSEYFVYLFNNLESDSMASGAPSSRLVDSALREVPDRSNGGDSGPRKMSAKDLSSSALPDDGGSGMTKHRAHKKSVAARFYVQVAASTALRANSS